MPAHSPGDSPLPNLAAAIDAARADAIRAQLLLMPLWLVIPPDLRDSFHAWRLRDLPRYIRLASLPLVMLAMLLTLLSNRFFSGELDAGDTRLWSIGSLSICSLIVIGVALAQIDAVRRRYAWLALPFGTLMIAKFVATPQLLDNAQVAAAESYFCMIAVTIVTLALRLTWLQAVAACIGGGTLGLAVTAFAFDAVIDWQALSYYFVSMSCVCLFVCWLFEEKEKVAFLQSLLLLQDAREKEALNRELHRLAHQDALSGLANRREFDRSMANEWLRQRREHKPLSVLFIDIDHFKAYNDLYGHAAGDDAITAIGGAIRSALHRPADLAARYGGEEFVILLPDTDAAGARDVARRVLDAIVALQLPHAASPTAAVITASIGVASVVPGEDDSPAELLAKADEALYRVKVGGRFGVGS